MKIAILLISILIPQISFCICDIGEALQTLRPKAEWNLRGTDYSGIEWLDANQTKPTRAEIIDAITQCQSDLASRNTLKAQARFVIRNSTATATQKVDAVILLMDLDK
jgi:hypothetical protein